MTSSVQIWGTSDSKSFRCHCIIAILKEQIPLERRLGSLIIRGGRARFANGAQNELMLRPYGRRCISSTRSRAMAIILENRQFFSFACLLACLHTNSRATSREKKNRKHASHATLSRCTCRGCAGLRAGVVHQKLRRDAASEPSARRRRS